MFDYFGILVSIILGLALTHLLRGIAKQILMRHTVRIYGCICCGQAMSSS
jgi:hypothetical protein